MRTVEIRDEFIRLGQLLKLTGTAASGSDARAMIEEGSIKVNGETELRRGRKLYSGDSVETEKETFMIHSPAEKGSAGIKDQ